MAEPYPEFRRLSDDSVRRRTGKGWSEWLAILDERGADHDEPATIAGFLNAEHGLDPRWARAVVTRFLETRHGVPERRLAVPTRRAY